MPPEELKLIEGRPGESIDVSQMTKGGQRGMIAASNDEPIA